MHEYYFYEYNKSNFILLSSNNCIVLKIYNNYVFEYNAKCNIILINFYLKIYILFKSKVIINCILQVHQIHLYYQVLFRNIYMKYTL